LCHLQRHFSHITWLKWLHGIFKRMQYSLAFVFLVLGDYDLVSSPFPSLAREPAVSPRRPMGDGKGEEVLVEEDVLVPTKWDSHFPPSTLQNTCGTYCE